jgi:ribonuclease R
MVNFNTMDEAFEIADSRLYITGKRSGVQVRMGDSVRVKIIDTDLVRRRIDMGWEALLKDEK